MGTLQRVTSSIAGARAWRATLLAAATGAMAGGCDEALPLDLIPTGSNDEVSRAADSVDMATLESALLAALSGSIAFEDDETAMAAAASTAAASVLTPSTCVQSVVAGATVTYTLQGCAGPYGLADITGVVNLAFTASLLGSAAVSLTAAPLQVNGIELAVNVTGSMSTNDAGQRSYELLSTGGGTLDRGAVVTRSGEFLLRIDGDCVRLDGVWATTIGESAWGTTITGLERCDDACPTSGVVVWGGSELDVGAEPDGRAVTITFDGSDEVTWLSSEGRIGRARLACGEP